jgi:hypothetical protein
LLRRLKKARIPASQRLSSRYSANPKIMSVVRIIPLLALLAACHSQKETKQLLTINKGLTQSLTFIKNNTNRAYASLSDQLHKDYSSYQTNKWAPTAFKNRDVTIRLISYIDSLEAELGKSRQLPPKTTQLLFDSLIRYRNSLIALFPASLGADYPDIRKQCQDLIQKLPLFHSISDSIFDELHYNAWVDTTISDNPLITLLALNKLKIEIALSEQMIAHFCELSCEPQLFSHSVGLEPLISVTNSIAQPGETIGITAGIGEFIRNGNPIVTISGHLLPMNDRGYAAYSLKAPLKPGKYTIPVRLEFTKPDGSREWSDNVVMYTVR